MTASLPDIDAVCKTAKCAQDTPSWARSDVAVFRPSSGATGCRPKKRRHDSAVVNFRILAARRWAGLRRRSAACDPRPRSVSDNARKSHYPGRPVVTEQQQRAELGRAFDILDRREFRFDESPIVSARSQSGSCLVRNRGSASPGGLDGEKVFRRASAKLKRVGTNESRHL